MLLGGNISKDLLVRAWLARAQVQQNLEKARRAAGGSFGPGARVVKLKDVVKDTPLPTFRLDIGFLLELLQPRRKLRPRRQKPKVRISRGCEV